MKHINDWEASLGAQFVWLEEAAGFVVGHSPDGSVQLAIQDCVVKPSLFRF